MLRSAYFRVAPLALACPLAMAIAPAPALAQQGARYPVPPTYAPIGFPTVPTHFCSEAEYWKFINEVINPQYLRTAENAERAARFRSEVSQAVNAFVQAGRAVPAELRSLERRANSEFAEHQRISERMAQLRGRAGRTPIIDCSKEQKPGGGTGTTPGPFDINPREIELRQKLWRAYSEFEDARERCDQVKMSEALAELERLAKDAHDLFSGIAMSMHGGPFPDQDPTPEEWEFYDAEADHKTAQRLLARARAARAAECFPCISPATPALTIRAAPPPAARPFVHAERALATWVNETDRLFDQLAEANLKGDCERIKLLIEQISARFGKSRNLWWAALVPAQYLLKWKWIFLRSAERCQPPPEQSDSIMDEIDHVPVISQAPADPTSAGLLAYHNQLRAEVGSPALRWNPALAASAGQYARVLADSGQLVHSSRQGRENERENIIVGRRGSGSPMTMAQTWGNERRLYTPGVFPAVCAGDWSTCAHYTQMVWSTTRDVGCAFAAGRQYQALVCRYSPPGNRDGRPVVEPELRFASRRACPPPP